MCVVATGCVYYYTSIGNSGGGGGEGLVSSITSGRQLFKRKPPPIRVPPPPSLFLFLGEGKKRVEGHWRVSSEWHFSDDWCTQDEEKKNRKKAKLEAFDVGAFSRLRVVNADVAIAIGTFTHVSILS